MRHFNQNELNEQWKGDQVKYGALHGWIRRHLPKPNECPICHRNKNLELSCIKHNYNRDLKNWLYMCRSCHTAIDQKILSIIQNRKKKRCPMCGTEIISPRNYCPPCAKQRRLEWWSKYNRKRRPALIRGFRKHIYPF